LEVLPLNISNIPFSNSPKSYKLVVLLSGSNPMDNYSGRRPSYHSNTQQIQLILIVVP